jgi:hypothetical protein
MPDECVVRIWRLEETAAVASSARLSVRTTVWAWPCTVRQLPSSQAHGGVHHFACPSRSQIIKRSELPFNPSSDCRSGQDSCRILVSYRGLGNGCSGSSWAVASRFTTHAYPPQAVNFGTAGERRRDRFETDREPVESCGPSSAVAERRKAHEWMSAIEGPAECDARA